MGLYEASPRGKHECPYRAISERYPGYPDLTIREWSLGGCPVLELASEATPTDGLLGDIRQIGPFCTTRRTTTGNRTVCAESPYS